MAERIFSLAGKRVYVAGHRGMVGSALTRRLERADCEVLTVAQWRELNKLSKSHAERILRLPKSQRPAIVQLGVKLRGIRKGENRRWQAARER